MRYWVIPSDLIQSTGDGLVYIYTVQKNMYSIPECRFVLANSVDPDEMPQYVVFHLCLHCLQKNHFRSLEYTKDLADGEVIRYKFFITLLGLCGYMSIFCVVGTYISSFTHRFKGVYLSKALTCIKKLFLSRRWMLLATLLYKQLIHLK